MSLTVVVPDCSPYPFCSYTYARENCERSVLLVGRPPVTFQLDSKDEAKKAFFHYSAQFLYVLAASFVNSGNSPLQSIQEAHVQSQSHINRRFRTNLGIILSGIFVTDRKPTTTILLSENHPTTFAAAYYKKETQKSQIVEINGRNPYPSERFRTLWADENLFKAQIQSRVIDPIEIPLSSKENGALLFSRLTVGANVDVEMHVKGLKDDVAQVHSGHRPDNLQDFINEQNDIAVGIFVND